MADIAFAGLTLGTGTALGATLGGLGNQNWRQLARKAYIRALGTEEMVLQNEVLLLTAERLLALVSALEQRGHAAQTRISLDPETGQDRRGKYRDLLRILQAARLHPDWEKPGDLQRTRVMEQAAEAARKLLPA